MQTWHAPAWRQRYWLHLALFLITLLTTTVMGARLAQNFHLNRPPFDLERDLLAFGQFVEHPTMVLQGLSFSLTLLAILLAHEFGHYVACRHYGVQASLPYFIPAPTLIGTFGAVIRIRSAVPTKRALFDIGIAGPLAGFVLVLPLLAIGLAFSKVIPGMAQREPVFGTPLLLWLLERLIFPGVPVSDIYLHPVARAAWTGVFATALNLLPIGQLDGGHILYAVMENKHKALSMAGVACLVPLGFVFWPWWLWAVALVVLGLRHPPIFGPAVIGRERMRLAWLALAIFVLCFMPEPVRP